MASKTPSYEPQTHSVKEPGNACSSTRANGTTNGDAADDSGGGSDDDPDEHGIETGGVDGATGEDGAVAKKKKNKRKKNKKKSKTKVQTDPPSVLISQLFPNNTYPKGEEVEYKDENLYRTTDEEKRYLDNMNSDFLSDYRQAAETHRQVRQWAQKNIKPGQTLTEIANGIEDSVRRLVGHDGLTEGDAIVAGMGFPTGLNLDEIAAHFSPNAGNKTVLQQNNVMKVDIGVHVNGRIVDSAFTMAFDHQYDNLLAAVKATTDTGVREAGIDVRLGELGALIQETMESYECEIGGETYPIKPIGGLSGHTILPYSIHGTKSVPSVRTDDMTKMEEGDVFAIETFGSTGTGRVRDQGEVSHYALRKDAPKVDLRVSSAKALLGVIQKNFSTLPFCRRYLDRIGQEKYLLGMKWLTTGQLNNLVKAGIVEDYPPLVDKKGSYTAQFEHTILLRPTVKEVISRGEDY
ncbi:methionine aminopeptidase 2 protein [Rutstroemia sp. NJR-2017a WRK4]|nr:methionine aminopeptidase 2 protein [Rutstroemia sp. NJR-2017a WRK4]